MNPFSSSGDGQPLLAESAWYHALTLPERIASLRTHQDGSMARQQKPPEQTATRLERWKKQFDPGHAELFAQRLEQDAITEPDLLRLLAEPVEELQARVMEQARPAWISDLERLWDLFPSAQQEAPLPGLPQDSSSPTWGVDQVLTPLAELGMDLLRGGLEHLHTPSQPSPFDLATLRRLFLPNLLSRLRPMLLRTLILEMHIARLEERLLGETSEARFAHFLRLLCQPAHFFALLHDYPLLARSLVTMTRNWADASREMIQHLCEDWRDLCQVFTPNTDLASLVEVRTGAGDTHRRGRSVTILRFSSGFQVVYKPRSLSLDQHFQEVLAWVNTLGLDQPLRLLTILDKGNHGWVEWVQVHDCSTQEEVCHFYERQGSYLALLYALDAADFHYENVLAAGEHPVLVDLEALFHSHLSRDDAARGDAAVHSMGYSVWRTGLLPFHVRVEEEGPGLDVSGLGRSEGEVTPWPVPLWKAQGTDQMHLAREHQTIPSRQNRPKLNGQHVETAEYLTDILKGFAHLYRLLVRHREEWLTQILPRFEQDEIRLILRPTDSYATLLEGSYYPRRLRDGFDRERLFDHLWDDVAFRSDLRRVIGAEREDLWQGDVPIFTTQTTSRDLFTSQGKPIKEFCREPSMESVKRRMRKMGEEDLALQQWIIQASLATTIVGDIPTPRVAPPSSSPSTVTREHLLQMALALGSRLQALAIRGDRGVNWLGVSFASESQQGTIRQLQPAGLTLYDGLPGIILFLSFLGKLTGDVRSLELADLALLTLDQQRKGSRSSRVSKGIGAFTGLGSLIYLFCCLGVLRGERTWLEQAQQVAEEADALIEQDHQFDLLSGAAGCIASLLALHHLAPSSRLLEVAIHCGEHLLTHAQTLAGGLGWVGHAQQQALAGFSHGAAGIAWSLFRLAQASQQPRFHQAALAALTYERSLFSSEQGNWARVWEQGERGFLVNWCHGAPGIGLARLVCLPYHDDAQMRQEISIALQTTLIQGFGRNYSLCHGDLGNLETLLVATQTLDQPRYHQELTRLTALTLHGMEHRGWLTGVPLHIETPGLMTGLAGMGYQLLRLAAPEKVPSVLSLALPRFDGEREGISRNSQYQGKQREKSKEGA